MTENQNNKGEDENCEDNTNLKKPNNIIPRKYRNETTRSKSSPIEAFEDDLDGLNGTKEENDISSYNYFVFYKNQNEDKKAHLPKPEYKKISKLGNINEIKDKVEEEEDETQDQHDTMNANDKFLGGISNDINNFSIQDNHLNFPSSNPNQNTDSGAQNLFNSMSKQQEAPSTLNYFQSANPQQQITESQMMWTDHQQNLMRNNIPPYFENSMMGMNPMIGMNMNNYCNLPGY